MSCNHDGLSTPFCPKCGEPAVETTGAGLLRHCVRTVDMQRKRLAAAKRDKDDPRCQWASEETVARAEHHLAKWHAWTTWVAERLEAQQ